MISMARMPHSSEHDPKITPWEERMAAQAPPARRRRGLRDWIVLIAAVMLGVYVLTFLFLILDTPSGGSLLSGGDVAIIPLKGEITSSPARDTVSFQEVLDAFDIAESNPDVKVILLDIDSPGGSVVPTHQIVSRIRASEKPVVSWIGEAGASGAYYAAAASDYIMADPDSITGSIGVISVQPKVSELMEKLGIQVEAIKTGELKDIGSPFRELTDEERVVFEQLIAESFAAFVQDIQDFRGEKLDGGKFDTVLDGRIVSGRQALEVGLIDELGTREEAIAKAAEIGNIAGKPGIIVIQREEYTIWDLLFSMGSQFGAGFSSSLSASASENAIPSLR